MSKKNLLKTSAYDLFLRNHFELASVNGIVKDAGVAKGTYYLYYQTKEEVYLDILADFYEEWFKHIQDSLEHKLSLNNFLEELISSFTKDKKFLELLCRANLILEKNLSIESIIAFKTKHKLGLSNLAKLISEKYQIGQEETTHRLLLTYACIIGIYQASRAPSCMSSDEFQELKCLSLDFEKEINGIIKRVWEA